MPLRPDDVVRKSFTTAILRRGYDEKQVDAFLEEVVTELRRLYGRIDELETQAAAVAARTPQDDVSDRVQREQQQVDLIRAERRDLVSELAAVQARLDASVAEADAAVARAAEAESAARDGESRLRETQEALDTAQARLLQARAEYDEAVAAQERVAVELRTLRTAAQERADAVLPGITLPAGESPSQDLDAIALVARALHDDYVESGRAEGQRLREEATASAEKLLAAAQEQADQIARAAQEEREALIAEAEAQRAGVLADLNARREHLEARIAGLTTDQEEYRNRLRAMVQDQLAVLDDEAWKV